MALHIHYTKTHTIDKDDGEEKEEEDEFANYSKKKRWRRFDMKPHQVFFVWPCVLFVSLIGIHLKRWEGMEVVRSFLRRGEFYFMGSNFKRASFIPWFFMWVLKIVDLNYGQAPQQSTVYVLHNGI